MLEQAILEALLSGDYQPFAILRAQLRGLVVSDRRMTGRGFFTKFEISSQCERLSGMKDAIFGDVEATIPGLKSGAGFLLFLKHGALDQLEGYSYGEDWPTHIDNFELSYFGGHDRDWEQIKRAFERT